LIGLVATGLLLSGCSDDETVAPPSLDPVSPDVVNGFVNSLPDWQVPSDADDPPVALDDEESLEDSQYYRCEVTEYDLKENFEQLIAVGANATALKPGMLVQGVGVKDGSLSTIGLKRSPLSVSINLAVDDPSRRVDVPTSASIQDAIAQLQREADDRLGNLDVVPAMINFKATTAYSFEQAMMSAGISVKYSAIFASGSVSAALKQQSSVKQHTVIVKLMQPMYTISFADDEMAEPADFFSAEVTEADFERQKNLGTMGSGNQPCYVQSVTYGRMLVYTATSTEATTAKELELAVQASYGAWEGTGNVDTRQQSLVRNSKIEVQVFGGTQGQALDAIKSALKNGDFSAFLTEVPATTAVPLSYRVNDLKNRQPAVIGDATKFSVRNCEPVNDLKFTVSLDSIIVVDGCWDEEEFDIESQVSVSNGQYYWLLHNSGTYFPKEDLPGINNQAVFTVEGAGAETQIEFFTAYYGNYNTGQQGWDKSSYFQFPFDFDENPYHFSHIETKSNSQYENCTLEVHYSIKRELK
jgi:hypothetical protein